MPHVMLMVVFSHGRDNNNKRSKRKASELSLLNISKISKKGFSTNDLLKD